MPISPHHISLITKSCNPIYRDAQNHYVSTIHIDILHGDDQEKIGEAKVYEVRMDHIVNDDEWSLFDIFDGHSNDLGNLYEELFDDDELIPAVADELLGYENIVLIKSIILKPEYRGQGLGGILALAIAELFGEQDILVLKPWPMNPDGPDNPAGVSEVSGNNLRIIKDKFYRLQATFENFPSFDQVERLMVEEALHATDGSRVDAARLLGISRTTLLKKLNMEL